jgi:transposase InsO family protein
VITDKPHIGAKNLYRVVVARFTGAAFSMPRERSVSRYLAHIKRDHAQMYTAIANPDKWKNRYMPAFGSASEDVIRLNQRWELDSTPAEVMLADGRHTIVQVCDIWSRRRVFYVAKTSSAAAVCEALRRAVIAWGIPEQVKIDNGKDYVSDRVQRAFRGLGAEVMISPPFSPWKKPHVERGFRTFLHGLFELLPGYLGHDVTEAQAIRASKSFAERMYEKNAVVEMRMTADDLQTFCDRWMAINDAEPTQGLGGLSPREQVARWTGDVRRITSERVLDLLLAEAPAGHGGRTVTKKGLRIEGHTYIAQELAPLVGERVQVFYDERDIGRIVVYHNEAFACVAACPEIAGVSRVEIAAAATAITHQRLTEQKAAKRKLKAKIRKVDLIETALALKEEQARPLALPPALNVIDATPQFAEAQRAAEALDDAAPVEAKPSRQEAVEWFEFCRDDTRAAQVQNETAEDRFRRGLALELKMLSEPLDQLSAQRLRVYQQSDEYQARRMMFEDWGPEYLGLGPEYRALLLEHTPYIQRLIAQEYGAQPSIT